MPPRPMCMQQPNRTAAGRQRQSRASPQAVLSPPTSTSRANRAKLCVIRAEDRAAAAKAGPRMQILAASTPPLQHPKEGSCAPRSGTSDELNTGPDIGCQLPRGMAVLDKATFEPAPADGEAPTADSFPVVQALQQTFPQHCPSATGAGEGGGEGARPGGPSAGDAPWSWHGAERSEHEGTSAVVW